jgi:hypothetical protein
MEPEHCLVHHLRQRKHLLNLLRAWHPAELILQGNGDFGFEEFVLLFLGRRESLVSLNNVAKLSEFVKF